MSQSSEALDEAIRLLHDSKAAKRESGAKRLRKLADPAAGAPLLDALHKELGDARTWAAQYQMILALGFCRHKPALPLLWETARRNLEHTILYSGLGDAIVRIEHDGLTDLRPVLQVVDTRNYSLINGALRAMALLKLVPSEDEISRIIEIAEAPEAVDVVGGWPGDPRGLRQWVAVAAALWPRPLVEPFLQRCMALPEKTLQLAVQDSLKGKMGKWNPY